MKPLIIVGIVVGAIGAWLFIGTGSAHAECSSIFTAGTQDCERVNAFYDLSIVAFVAGAVMIGLGVIRSWMQSQQRPHRQLPEDQQYWNRQQGHAPPGWYPQGNGVRYWDGQHWGEYRDVKGVE